MAGKPPVAGRGTEDWGEASWEDRAEELSFVDENDRLPWLDASDDVTGAGKADRGRVVGFGLLALALLGLVAGGGWWLATRDTGPLPDGGLIAAPAEPYKVRPADPGGKQHAGTGDTSFAVGEGQSREARLAEAPPATAPSASVAAISAAASQTDTAPAPAATEEPAPAAVPGVGVQVGAYYNADAAERGWATLARQTEALREVRHRVVRGVADIGTVYRLQAVAPDAASAQQLCDALRADGLTCQVKR